jgi:pilus assembly protein CpaF
MSLMARLEKDKKFPENVTEKKPTSDPSVQTERPERQERSISHLPTTKSPPDLTKVLKVRVQEILMKEIDQELLDRSDETEIQEKLQEKISEVVQFILENEHPMMTRADRQRIITEICDEVLGFGPINSLLLDPTISEVMVNGPFQIYVERRGKLELAPVRFRDNEHVLHIIEKIVAPIGRRIDESSPMVDARLPDGSRVNAIIPPLALKGPSITIRKFSRDPFTINDLINFGTLSPEMGQFLEACVRVKLNILVSGGTGSGKTTTLNVLSSFIPADERIVTIEDAAELQLRQDHVVSLETRPPNIEGKGSVTMRDLVRNSLRMRPDRIIVGEVRGGEALDMLQAMNTGHDGSITTGHANTPRDMIARLETMVLMAGMELPAKAIREQIASAINLIVQQSRLRDGSRKIINITEVQGMEGETIVLQDIFTFEQKGVDENGKIIGRLKATGLRPKFLEHFERSGMRLPPELFAVY